MKAERYSQNINKLTRKCASLLYTQSRYELRPIGLRMINRYKAMAEAEKIAKKLVQIQKILKTAIWLASCPSQPCAETPNSGLSNLSCQAPPPSRVSSPTSSPEWLNCDLGAMAFAAKIGRAHV